MDEVKIRKEAIADIEALFPTDSQYEATNLIGERLLAQAKREVEQDGELNRPPYF